MKWNNWICNPLLIDFLTLPLPPINAMPNICQICQQILKEGKDSIQCTSCLCGIHHDNLNNCSGLTDTEVSNHHNKPYKQYQCDKCKTKTYSYANTSTLFSLPFSTLDENDWLKFNDIKSGPKNLPNHDLISFNVKDFVSQCSSIQNLINLDEDAYALSPQINSKYSDIKQFNSLKLDLPYSFGLFHVSLNKHIDDLQKILSQLKYNFDIIGISEHKILKCTTPSNTIEIPGYDNFIFEPTDTNFGGTGFYVKDNLDYVRRSDLEINSPTNYETIFIEIKFPKKKNLIVGCIYRHPSSKISVKDLPNLHLDPVLQTIGLEKTMHTHG